MAVFPSSSTINPLVESRDRTDGLMTPLRQEMMSLVELPAIVTL